VRDQWDRKVFSWGLSGLGLGIALLCVTFGVWTGLTAALMHAVLYVFVLTSVINGLGSLARGPELCEYSLQLARPGLGDGRGESAQQPPRASAGPEVQHGPVRVRSLVGDHPVPGRRRAGQDHRSAR
jgi:hypothetical protein